MRVSAAWDVRIGERMTTDVLAALKGYLESMAQALLRVHDTEPWQGYRYRSYEALMLAEGWSFPGHPLPIDRGAYRMPEKRCYWNALELTRRRRSLRYCEGFALAVINGTSMIPVKHAFAVEPFRQSSVALVRAPTEEVFRHVAVGTADDDVLLLRMPEQQLVEAICLIPVDAEGSTMGCPTPISVVKRQELIRLFATADALPTVQGHDLLARFAPNLLAVQPSLRPRVFRVSRSTFSLLDTLLEEAVVAASHLSQSRSSPAITTDTASLGGSPSHGVPLTTASTRFIGGRWRTGTGGVSTCVLHPDIIQQYTGISTPSPYLRARDGGTVWDPTWPEPEHSAYWGMVFERDEIQRYRAALAEHGVSKREFAILELEWRIGAPLLRHGALFPD